VSWRVVLRSEIRRDLAEAAAWYDGQSTGLGREFVAAVLEVFKSLAENPYLNARRSRRRQVRWRLPQRFPYRVIYEVREAEQLILVVAVLHSARHDRHWRQRLD
jgi:toxin ParE1/3/4